MSALHTDAKEVHQAYDEALKTCKYKVYGKERLLLSAQPAEEGEYKYYLPKKEEDLLKEALKCRNTRKTEMVIENVLQISKNRKYQHGMPGTASVAVSGHI